MFENISASIDFIATVIFSPKPPDNLRKYNKHQIIYFIKFNIQTKE